MLPLAASSWLLLVSIHSKREHSSLVVFPIGSATQIHGSFQRLGRLWLRQCRLEGKNGELEAETRQAADDEEGKFWQRLGL